VSERKGEAEESWDPVSGASERYTLTGWWMRRVLLKKTPLIEMVF
jgi:hypothetical protein